jgi:DNA-binding NtrC family response regulator
MPQQTREVQGNELEFIFRSLVELKLQVEDLRRRVDSGPPKVEVIDVGRVATADYEEIGDGMAQETHVPDRPDRVRDVIYRPGMKMADVERAAIESALRETKGNRRRAAEKLGIGERTLYRKIKEYQLD